MTPLLILAAHLADLAAFGLAVQVYGIGGEANPLAAAVFLLSLPLLVAVKMAGAIAAALICSRLPRRWGLAAAGVGMAGAMTAIGVLV